MCKKIFFFSILILIMFDVLHTQSVFSFYGPADILYQRDAYGEGMGGTGAGDMYRINTNLVNPALSTTVNRVYFSTGITIGTNFYTYNHGIKNSDSQFSLPYFTLVFPYRQHRFGFHYTNLASAGMKSKKEYEEPMIDGYVTLKNETTFSLYRAGVFYANRNKRLNFGVGANYLFGNDSINSSQSFDSPQLTDSKINTENRFQNPMFNIGISKNMGSFSFGMAASYPMELTGTSNVETNSGSAKSGDASFEYPATATFGMTYRLTDYFFLSTDFDYEMWGNTNSFENSVDAMRLGAGLSWAGIPHTRKFLLIFPFRAGMSYRNLPFTVSDSYIHEIAYHLGISLPLRGYDSYMEVATKFYNRGNIISETDFSENGFLITVGLHGFDFFRRPPNRKMPRDIPKTFEEQAAERSGGRRSHPEGE